MRGARAISGRVGPADAAKKTAAERTRRLRERRNETIEELLPAGNGDGIRVRKRRRDRAARFAVLDRAAGNVGVGRALQPAADIRAARGVDARDRLISAQREAEEAAAAARGVVVRQRLIAVRVRGAEAGVAAAVAIARREHRAAGVRLQIVVALDQHAAAARVVVRSHGAKAAALDVINNSGFTLLTQANYLSFWSTLTPRTDKVETLFETSQDQTNNSGFEGIANLYNQGGYGDFLVADDLYASYEATDVRRGI